MNIRNASDCDERVFLTDVQLRYVAYSIRVHITVTVNSRILPPSSPPVTYINYRLLSTLQRAFRRVEWQPRNYPIRVGKKREKKKRRSQSSEEKRGEWRPGRLKPQKRGVRANPLCRRELERIRGHERPSFIRSRFYGQSVIFSSSNCSWNTIVAIDGN